MVMNRIRWAAVGLRRAEAEGVVGSRLSVWVAVVVVVFFVGLVAASRSGVPWIHHGAMAVIHWLNAVDNVPKPPR